ncbi:MAG: sulfatase-like hydrolase/transferase, partial [Acidobacteria bacterium]|nr:sulfatase-like hydrolase/transferase [Acidobacteriota bacterium]
MSQLATELPSPAPASGTSPGRPSLPAFALHLVTLYALAVAQPLFSLLAKNPEFFAARDLGRGAVIGLTLALILLPPLPAVLVGAAARRLGSTRLQQLCDALLVAAPTALLVLYAGRGSTSPLASGPLALATAPLVALAFAWLYQRRAEVRLFVSYLSIAVLAVPAVFLFGVWPLGAPEAPAPVAPGPAAASVPLIPTAPKTIVLIVFDEMSGQSLLDAEHRIDAARFPNLAALAATSSWYRNATAASDATVTAVPAILTGRKPRIAQLATLAYHPDNLFTRLGGRYQVIAREYLTHLCPGDCNGPNEAPPPADTSVSSLRLLAEDLGIVYLHLVVPRPYDQRLPPVGSDWSGFAGTQRYDYPRDFRSFLATLKSGPPTLYVLHTHLPHQPYEYLPSGKSYQLSAPLLRPDPRAYRGQIEMVYRRYLLQLGLVDRLVGELIDQLRSERLFDQSLLIVTADHGPRYVRRSAFAKGGDPADAYTPIYLRGPGDSAAQSE